MTNESAHAQRTRAIGMAVLSSLMSKGGTALLMLISIPLAFKVLGEARYGVFGVVQTLMFFITMSDLGMGPEIMRRITGAVAKGDRDEETTVISCGFFIALGFVMVAAVLFWALMTLVPVTTLFGAGFDEVQDELRTNLWLAGGMFLTMLMVSMLERAREGYQEIHIGNTFGAVQNVIAACVLYFGVQHWPTVTFLMLAIYGTQALTGAANAMHLLYRRPWLIPRWSKVDRQLGRRMMREGLALFTAGTMAPIFQREGTKWLVGQMMGHQGPAVLGRYTILIQLGFFLYGFVLMVSRPLWPAVADAVARGDMEWVRAARRRISKWALILGGLTVAGFTVLGPWLAETWLRKPLEVQRLDYGLFSLSFVLMVWSHFHYVILAGIGSIRPVARVLTWETVTVLVLAWIGIPWFGLSGALGATVLGVACFSGWRLPLILNKALKSGEAAVVPHGAKPPAEVPASGGGGGGGGVLQKTPA